MYYIQMLKQSLIKMVNWDKKCNQRPVGAVHMLWSRTNVEGGGGTPCVTESDVGEGVDITYSYVTISFL